jgi:hypothetical protein
MNDENGDNSSRGATMGEEAPKPKPRPVLLKSLRAVLELLQPLEPQAAADLRTCMRSVLSDPRATTMSLEAFYAFASALESVAYSQSPETGDKVRSIIKNMIIDHGGDSS